MCYKFAVSVDSVLRLVPDLFLNRSNRNGFTKKTREDWKGVWMLPLKPREFLGEQLV